jgi:hypothetical protein
MPRKRRDSKACSHDLFTDYPLTKSELTAILGVSRDSVVRWSNLAFFRIPTFRESYPKKSDGSFDSEAPLNPYQCWILSRLGREFQKLRTAERVRLGIKNNPSIYSKYTYQNALRNLTKITA